MARSLNKATLIGNLGEAPEIKTMQSGDRVCNFNLATSESWKDKATGEVKQRTQWHRVVVFNQGLLKVCENYLEKGSKVYLEGQIETRSYEKDGKSVYTTEIVLRPYTGEIILLGGQGKADDSSAAHEPGVDELEDEIPF